MGYLSILSIAAGVSQLSRSEVRKDLDEIEVLVTGVSLGALDDIKVLASFYPVKPRIELKIPEHLKAAQRSQQQQQQLLAADADNRDAGDLPFAELLEFLRLVEVVRPDLLDAEREREQLEGKYMVSRHRHGAEHGGGGDIVLPARQCSLFIFDCFMQCLGYISYCFMFVF
jgi:hypothetical protein